MERRFSLAKGLAATCLIGAALWPPTASATPINCNGGTSVPPQTRGRALNPLATKSSNWNSPVPAPAVLEKSRATGKMSALAGLPPTLLLTPAVISSRFFGHLDLRISNLAAGTTVKIERFQVNNNNGAIDSAGILLSSYLVTDGQLPVLNGITNTTVVSDSTPADGIIQTRLEYLDPFVQNLAGEYVLRVSSPSGAFAPATRRLSISPEIHPQRFSGQVRVGAAGVPFAYVAALTATGAGGEFAAGTVADESGHYAIPLPAGAYRLIATRPGLVGNIGRSTLTRLQAGTNQITDLTLVAGTRKLSGRLFDLDNPGLGLAGVQLFGRTDDGERFTIAYTDADGRWTMAVTPEKWRVTILPQAVIAAGYVGLQEEPYWDAKAGDVRDVNIGLPMANRLVHGTVRDLFDGSPVSDCAVEMWSIDLNFKVRVMSDAQGRYVAPVFAGQWIQMVNPESVVDDGYAGTKAITLNVLEDGILESNHFLSPLATTVLGDVVDDFGKPVPGTILSFLAVDASDRAWTSTETDESGQIDGEVPEGMFRARVDMPNTYYDLIEVESAPFRASLDSKPKLKLLMKTPTSRLLVHVEDNFGLAVVNWPLFADARINGAVHRTFDFTDEEGVADLGVVPGEWRVLLDLDKTTPALSLATYGYVITTNRVVTIAAEDVEMDVTVTAVPPELSVTPIGPNLRLAWPYWAGSVGFGLESSPAATGPWKAVNGSPLLTGATLSFDVEKTAAAGYFRLRRP